MCDKAPVKKSVGVSVADVAIGTGLVIYTIGFLFLRIGELIPLFCYYTVECTSAFIGTYVLSRFLGRRANYLLILSSMIALIYIMDSYVPKPLPAASESYSSKTRQEVVVITDVSIDLFFVDGEDLDIEEENFPPFKEIHIDTCAGLDWP